MQIAILDDDHVIRIARYALSGPGEVSESYVRDFFLPEEIDPARVFDAGRGPHQADGVSLIRMAAKFDIRNGGDVEVIIFVSVHATNLPAYRRLIDSKTFGTMKPTAYFINTARGPLVDEDALYDALTKGVIAGAGLDVHVIEPRPIPSPLATLGNVIFTPHIAGRLTHRHRQGNRNDHGQLPRDPSRAADRASGHRKGLISAASARR